VKYTVRKSESGKGYDVLINDKLINKSENNKWEFIDKIEAKTGCTDWYVGFSFKDGDYNAAKFTIKTINGKEAVDKSVSGYIQHSLLPDGGEYVAVGGKLGQYAGGATAETTTTQKSEDPTTTVGGNNNTTKQPDGATTTVNGEVTTTVGGDETTTTEGGDTDPTTTVGGDTNTTTASNGDEPTDTDPQGSLGWLLWVGIAVVVIAAGVCIYLFVIRPKTKK